jgi:hypothetical protein
VRSQLRHCCSNLCAANPWNVSPVCSGHVGQTMHWVGNVYADKVNLSALYLRIIIIIKLPN